jgi:tetratricopeptide (TPR) repeat protein
MLPRMSDLIVQARALNQSLSYPDTLALLDGDDTASAALVRIRALIGLERFGLALHELDRVDPKDLDEAEGYELRTLRARAWYRGQGRVDDALEHLLELMDEVTAPAEPTPVLKKAFSDAALDAAELYGRKRARTRAEGMLARFRLVSPEDDRALGNEGFMLVTFDERTAARDKFKQILAGPGNDKRMAHLGLSYVALLMGEFADAHAELDLVPLASGDIYARRQRMRLLSAEGRWNEAVTVLDDILAVNPQGDWALHDRLERANSLYRAGRTDEARQAYGELAAMPPERGSAVRLAQRSMRLLSRAEAATLPRRRLKMFPSVVQLHNHCGPASCELYLRFFGVNKEQVEIAREIKFPDGGTPVYRMARFLEASGFHTRRVEADLPRIRQLIDAGIPVILEEEYSSSRHVAVAIGYDDVREILEVQDPMTHAVRETFYEDLGKLQSIANHGSLVAVPSDKPELLAALDAAGAAPCEYMRLTDEAWAEYDLGMAAGRAARGETEPDKVAVHTALGQAHMAAAEEKVRRSLELRREYELSWFLLFTRASDRAHREPSPETKVAVHQILAEIQSIWPDDEWPQKFLGEVLYFENRNHDALAAFERARDRDPDDASNWSWIADCLLSLGRSDDALGALRSCLDRDPGHTRGNENLAYLMYKRDRLLLALALNGVALDLNPGNSFNHAVHGDILGARKDLAGAVNAYEKALSLDPNRTSALIARSKLLARLGRLPEGTAALQAYIDKDPDGPSTMGLRIELADLCYNHADWAGSAAASRGILERIPEHASGHAILGAALAAGGSLDEGLVHLDRALKSRPTYAWVYAEKGKALAAAGRHMEAIQCLAASLGLNSDSRREFELGSVLAKAGYEGDAVSHMRAAAHGGRLDFDQLYRVGTVILAADGGNAMHGLFNELGDKGGVPVLRAHATLLLEEVWAPQMARPVVEQLARLAPQDPLVKTLRGADLMDRSLHTEVDGEKLLREAVEGAKDMEFPRRFLSQRLLDRGRFEDVLAVLEPASGAWVNVDRRVRALVGLGREAEAETAIETFEREHAEDGKPAPAGAMLRYHVARRRWDWKAALDLAERSAGTQGELEDDGRLGHWETEKFECLLRLGEVDRAIRFGTQQAGDGFSLGTLAHEALNAGHPRVAGELAEHALRLQPDEAYALHAMARVTELDGDTEAAQALFERSREADPSWHTSSEDLARFAIAVGDLQGAVEHAEAAVARGHVCPWAMITRAQVRMVTGDLLGARTDADRAWTLAKPEVREHENKDAWAIRALAHGDLEQAETLFAAYLAAPDTSVIDKARIEKVRAAVSAHLRVA